MESQMLGSKLHGLVQVFGVQLGNPILQNAAHGVERTKD